MIIGYASLVRMGSELAATGRPIRSLSLPPTIVVPMGTALQLAVDLAEARGVRPCPFTVDESAMEGAFLTKDEELMYLAQVEVEERQ